MYENSLNWDNARTQATRSVFRGVAGYLATITSDAESQFVRGLFRLLTRILTCQASLRVKRLGLEPMIEEGRSYGLVVPRLGSLSRSPTGQKKIQVEDLKTVSRSLLITVNGTTKSAGLVAGLSLSTRVRLGRSLAPLHVKVGTVLRLDFDLLRHQCMYLSTLRCQCALHGQPRARIAIVYMQRWIHG